MTKVNYALMYVTDDSIADNSAFFHTLEAALKGGATIIQLREKNRDTKTFYKRALKAKQLCAKYQIPLIINDRLDIALAIDADGIHLGQTDMPAEIARKLIGPQKIIGLSVSNTTQVNVAKNLPIDYIGISPIFATNSKVDHLDSPVGIEGLKKIRKDFSKPITCIGGINSTNTAEIIENGSDGIAVISAISKATDPEKATKQLKDLIWQTGLKK